VPPEHGNVSLHEEDVLILMLCGFFEPMARSLRTIEQLAQVDSVKQHLQVEQVPKSTLSDAMAAFGLSICGRWLRNFTSRCRICSGWTRNLRKWPRRSLPGWLAVSDGGRRGLGHAAGARTRTRTLIRRSAESTGGCAAMDDRGFCGNRRGTQRGRAAAMKPMLQSGVLYLFDRAYYPFNFINSVLEVNADLVCD